jgi:hypothetical protein
MHQFKHKKALKKSLGIMELAMGLEDVSGGMGADLERSIDGTGIRRGDL